MSIILISSDRYETGRAVAQKVAEVTEYAFLDREILGDAARASDIPEPKSLSPWNRPPPHLVFPPR